MHEGNHVDIEVKVVAEVSQVSFVFPFSKLGPSRVLSPVTNQQLTVWKSTFIDSETKRQSLDFHSYTISVFGCGFVAENNEAKKE